MFWKKCGHLLTENGKLVNCRDCPCGYWALFAFVIRSYNRDTGEVDFCNPYVMVEIKNVVNSKINFSGYMYERCIEINRAPDSEGRHGYVKSCEGCWEYCVEWDENWENCLRTEEYCDDCSEIEVYRIGGCFDTQQELAAFFYEPCGIGPDESGKYPDLMERWGSYYYMTGTAYECIEAYWNNYAQRYMPQFNLVKTQYEGYVAAFTNSSKYNQVEYGTYTWCDGECLEWGDYGCTECDGTMYEEKIYDYVYAYDCHYVTHSWNPEDDNAGIRICSWEDEGGHGCDCAPYWQGAVAGLAEVNAEVEKYLGDYTQWSTNETTLSGRCMSFEYISEWKPNECWASWPIDGIFRWWARKVKLKVERHPSTPPEAKGIVADVYCYRYLGKDAGSYDEIMNQQQEGIEAVYNGKVELNFGSELDLPEAHNMTLLSVANSETCEHGWDWQYPEYNPKGVGCAYPAKVTFSIKVRKYIF